MSIQSIGLIIININDLILDTSIVLESALRNAVLDFYPNFNFGNHEYLKYDYTIPIHTKLGRLKRDLKAPFHIIEKIDWAYEEYVWDMIKHLSLSNNVKDFLNEIKCKGSYVVLISNTRKPILKEIVKQTRLFEYADYIKCTCDGDVSDMIPDPHIIDYMCKKFKMPKSNTLYIDQQDIGHYMALQAGCHFMEVENVENVHTKLLKDWRLV